MKKLLLCRHADALPPTRNQHDIERELSEEGKIQCSQGKNWILQHIKDSPEIVCSSAIRTVETTKLLAQAFKDADFKSYPELYECPSRSMLRFVNNYAGPGHFLMITAHNPGISNFASELIGDYISFATGQIVLLKLFSAEWREVSFGAAEIEKVFIPD